MSPPPPKQFFIGCFAYKVNHLFPRCGACTEEVFQIQMETNLLVFIEGQTYFSTSFACRIEFDSQ